MCMQKKEEFSYFMSDDTVEQNCARQKLQLSVDCQMRAL